jgi:cell division protein ZapA (FtsZ GTPase activity inhibitor)
MPIVTITLNNKNFKLFCNDGSEELLHSLATTINDKMMQLKTTNQSAPFELLLILTTLSLQQEIHNLQDRLGSSEVDNDHNEREQFAETLSSIATYLESLAQKIGK